ncbi:uncharacterized protein BJ212DRAFT_1299328 [Suillus subaureus]|uniref:Uncharacterized protein n=1 Tax=Suillus subaureus TaxID=48587 RepID=A0A9P7JDZ9_9AGAM|nr:uncharacterized protein BJ212DRAFT_1299328 [Suillus subaureus]KAG1817164.1 hypothetical protein BJ212DRAFT_1299328 [Suillus subaureus]
MIRCFHPTSVTTCQVNVHAHGLCSGKGDLCSFVTSLGLVFLLGTTLLACVFGTCYALFCTFDHAPVSHAYFPGHHMCPPLSDLQHLLVPHQALAHLHKKYGKYFLFGQYHPFQSYVCRLDLANASNSSVAEVEISVHNPGDTNDLHLPQLTSEGRSVTADDKMEEQPDSEDDD